MFSVRVFVANYYYKLSIKKPFIHNVVKRPDAFSESCGVNTT